MSDRAPFGWILLVLGVVIAGAGLLWIVIPTIPWLGRFSGDIRIERGNSLVCIVTSVLLSIIFMLVLWIISLFRR